MKPKNDNYRLITSESVSELKRFYGKPEYMKCLQNFIIENRHKLFFIHIYNFNVKNSEELDNILAEISAKYFEEDVDENIIYDICLHYLDYIENDEKFSQYFVSSFDSQLYSKNFFGNN